MGPSRVCIGSGKGILDDDASVIRGSSGWVIASGTCLVCDRVAAGCARFFYLTGCKIEPLDSII